jgi:hypothetical protein
MLGVFLFVPIVAFAGCIALWAAFITSDPRAPCSGGSDNVLLMEAVPAFLDQQPCIDRAFGLWDLTYEPAFVTAPRVHMDLAFFPVPEFQPHNPIAWKTPELDAAGLQYSADLSCDGVDIQLSVTWRQVSTRQEIDAQLVAIADELNARCEEYDYTTPPTPGSG